MALLREIQDAAVNPDVDISFLLRKCKILASRLKNPEFSNWVDQELNGYKSTDSLPDYRVARVHSKGHFAGPGGSGLRNANIPLTCIDQKYRKYLDKCYCMQPISAYVDLLKSSKGGNFQEPWPPDLVARVGMNIYEYMNCLTAWKVLPRTVVVALIDAVRNRVLNFVLEIEAQAPDAGEAPLNKPPLPQEQVTHIFHTHIYGNVGNIAQGSQDVTQTATMHIAENNIQSLKTYLESLGMTHENISALEIAIEEDCVEDVKQNKRLGSRVSAWLGSVMSGIAQGIIPILQNVDANLITEAILRYYGIK